MENCLPTVSVSQTFNFFPSKNAAIFLTSVLLCFTMFHKFFFSALNGFHISIIQESLWPKTDSFLSSSLISSFTQY